MCRIGLDIYGLCGRRISVRLVSVELFFGRAEKMFEVDSERKGRRRHQTRTYLDRNALPRDFLPQTLDAFHKLLRFCMLAERG